MPYSVLFLCTGTQLTARIDLLLNLPVDRLERMALKAKLDERGAR